MDRLAISVTDLRSALEEEFHKIQGDIQKDIISSKMNPLKTNKQRNNTSNNHRKNQQRSDANSTDDERHRGQSQNENEVTANNENGDKINEDTGLVDSDNENIADRLCSLSKLSIHVGHEQSIAGTSGSMSTPNGISETVHLFPATHPVAISKQRNASCPSFPESDSFTEIFGGSSKFNTSTIQSSSGHLPTTGDCASGGATGEMNTDYSERRFRRRRRRRGHNTNSKRMAVDASPDNNNCGEDEMARSYSIRPSPAGAGCSSSISSKKLHKIDKSSLVDPLDNFGMKRKRTIVSGGGNGSNSIQSKLEGCEGDLEMEEVCRENSSTDVIDDEEMKSENDEYSSFESADEEDDDDRDREADDEQSDWVFDEWNSNSKKVSQEESAFSRKKRLLKMLRSYNTMISGNCSGDGSVPSGSQLPSREIRAGKRRVLTTTKAGLPPRGIWTSANEEVSKFLQDPLQSQIRLQPISVEERVQLSQLASLYSLRMDMDYCGNREELPVEIPTINYQDEDASECGLKVFPVLTKTPNTTQMDKNNDPSASSPFNAEGSSSSNVSSVYCPTFSEVDSKTSDSKRIKK